MIGAYLWQCASVWPDPPSGTRKPLMKRSWTARRVDEREEADGGGVALDDVVVVIVVQTYLQLHTHTARRAPRARTPSVIA